VDVLVERGLISRRRNAQDRRNIPLELTKDGNRLLDAIWEKNKAWMGEKMAGLTGEELKILSRAMDTLQKVFSQS
jgi:DNA-binding MarR family transcriptional regulator